ncbi:MAG: hypothetical protein ABW154_05585 [Dyella sp.]
MLLFYGKPAQDLASDENASRAARLKALRTQFYAWKRWDEFAPAQKDNQTHAMAQAIREEKRLDQLKGSAEILVLNAHGSPATFAGGNGKAVADNLIGLGIAQAGTREVWVAACSVGQQAQDNSQPPTLFIKELYRTLREQPELASIKVYGPRGVLSYGDKRQVDVGSGQSIIEYGRVYIRSHEREYPFNEGWVLATLP